MTTKTKSKTKVVQAKMIVENTEKTTKTKAKATKTNKNSNKFLNQSPIIIENIQPVVDNGKFLAKTSIDISTNFSAVIFKDGHDILSAELKYKAASNKTWKSLPLTKAKFNDTFSAQHVFDKEGLYEFKVEAWVNPILNTLINAQKRLESNLNPSTYLDAKSDMLELSKLYDELKTKVKATKKKTFIDDICITLSNITTSFNTESQESILQTFLALIENAEFQEFNQENFLQRLISTSEVSNEILVERKLATFGAWYELFPRSQGKLVEGKTPRHTTFIDCIERLADIKEMGFDVIYLPPIHPIGRTNRKGPNNTLTPTETDPGSPWAIGASEGGHKDVHPELGSLKDFKAFVKAAADLDIEIALDFAIQCSPDHPYVQSNPEWFYQLPDGTIRYAENPPKKYQDIYPINFDNENKEALWTELKSIVEFWIKQGVSIFRVDNPHTKSLSFWQWMIEDVKAKNPEVIFLSEAFTKPHMMKRLAKIGFTQSYTYFTWKNSKQDLIEYMTELSTTEMKDYYRPNFFANTPDILNEYLVNGGLNAFKIRAVLAATLSPSYGIYSGFEFGENTPVKPGSEEYLNSEKYEVKARNWNQEPNIKALIKQINELRNNSKAFQQLDNLEFEFNHNENILAFTKQVNNEETLEKFLVIVNLDPANRQEDTIHLNLERLGLNEESFEVEDLLNGDRYTWQGGSNYVALDPNQGRVAHIFKVSQ